MTDPSPSTSSERMVTLVSNDDETFQVARNVLRQSNLINNMFTDLGLDDLPEDQEQKIPLPNINSEILKLVIEFLEHHRNDPIVTEEQDNREKRTDDIPAWDMDFLKVDQKTLFELILAGNYLDTKGLLTSCCKTVANMIKGKTAEQIRETFHIKNDLTPEEEEQIRKENAWCED